MSDIKYPSIKCTPQLWEEIKPVVVGWGCEIVTNCLSNCTRIVSNYGNENTNEISVGYTNNELLGDRRYLVKTKDEFLRDLAKLLGKEYSSSLKLNKQKKIVLNFKV